MRKLFRALAAASFGAVTAGGAVAAGFGAVAASTGAAVAGSLGSFLLAAVAARAGGSQHQHGGHRNGKD